MFQQSRVHLPSASAPTRDEHPKLPYGPPSKALSTHSTFSPMALAAFSSGAWSWGYPHALRPATVSPHPHVPMQPLHGVTHV